MPPKRQRESSESEDSINDENEHDLLSSWDYSEPVKFPEGSLQGYLSDLLESGRDSDILLKTKDNEIPAHKILLRRSGYFTTLFDGQWKESTKVELNCDDILSTVPGASDSTLEALVHYLYTDRCDFVSPEEKLPLAHLARYFDVPKLVQDLFDLSKGFDKLIIGKEFDLFGEISNGFVKPKEPAQQLCFVAALEAIIATHKIKEKGGNDEDDEDREFTVSDLKMITDNPYFPEKSKFDLVRHFLDTCTVEEEKKSAVNLLPLSTLDRSISFDKIPENVQSEVKIFRRILRNTMTSPPEVAPNFPPTIVHFVRNLPSDESFLFEISEILGIRIVCRGGERSSAYWWTFMVHNKFKFSVRVTMVYRNRIETESNKWEKNVNFGSVDLTDNIPRELEVVYDMCDQGQAIGVDVQGIFVVECLPDIPWSEKDPKVTEYYIKNTVDWFEEKGNKKQKR